ncbi:methionine adenosyltransferase [Chloroflexus sp.]|uniref:methionine adenosyltransferase n=1 Tax=Chloroflexus sp. TaxID=1904827 RepID=UPI0026236CB7|nr:methionine adenosyltransferase [uncultured Chloroflexus sp.]
MPAEYVFTSESVTAGHPDKLCDQISDAIVGHFLWQDPRARVVAECAVSSGILFVSLRASGNAWVDIPRLAREVMLEVGYDRGSFDGRTCTIMLNQIEEQPSGSRRPVRAGNDDLTALVAQENVTLFGFACTQTPVMMPLPIWLANRLAQQLGAVCREHNDILAPDGKVQVGVVFSDHQPQRLHSITLVASQRRIDLPLNRLRELMIEQVVQPVFAGEPIKPDSRTSIQINPEGPVLEGGPALHAGLTGRKNGSDTYGGFARQGSAALSGKDPTRIDRTGAYAARHAAKQIVAVGLAEHCEIQLSYSIGQAQPVSVRVETFGSGRLSDDELSRRVAETFDFSVGGIIRRFHLDELAGRSQGRFYQQLAAYGHFGRTDLTLPWETIDHSW